jgi:hypothetical protein
MQKSPPVGCLVMVAGPDGDFCMIEGLGSGCAAMAGIPSMITAGSRPHQ